MSNTYVGTKGNVIRLPCSSHVCPVRLLSETNDLKSDFYIKRNENEPINGLGRKQEGEN